MEMKETKGIDNGVVKGTAYLTLSVLIVKIIGFIYKLPISYLIGDEGMGYFNSAYTVFSFFYLICTGGVPKAVSVFVATERAKGREDYARKILRCALSLFLIVGVVLSTFLLIFAHAISSLIGNNLAWFSLICIAPSILFVAAGGVLRGYLNGEMRLGAIALSQLLEGVFKFVVGLSFALLGVRLSLGVPIISALTILGITVSSFIGTLVLYLFTFDKLKKVKNEATLPSSREILKKLIKISLPITASTAISGISGIIDLSLIMRRLSDIGYTEAEASALYGNYTTLALPLLTFATSLLVPISTAAIPVIASAAGEGNFASVRENALKFIRATAFFAFPLCFGFLLFSNEILTLLFEDNSASVAAPLLCVLAPSVVFLSILTLMNSFLEATGRTKTAFVSMSVGCIIKVIISYLLIGSESIGILGAPIGTTASYAVSMVLSCAFLYKFSDVKIGVFKELFKPLLISMVSVTVGRSLYLALSKNTFSVPIFIFCVFICAIIYLILSFLFSIIDIKHGKNVSNITKIDLNNWGKRRNSSQN